MIDHGHALGHPDRMMVGQDHDAEAQANALGQATERPEHHLGAGRHRETGQKMVLDEPHRVEAHLLG
jgi:hypothetical protein